MDLKTFTKKALQLLAGIFAGLILIFCGGGGGGGGAGGEKAFAVSIISPSGNVTITQGQSIDFLGTASGGTEPFQYLWTFGGAAPSSRLENPGSVTFASVGVYTVVFQVTDARGLTSSASDTITVTVSATGTDTSPVASITSPPGNVTITSGQSVNFQGSVAGGDAPFSYLWTFGGGIPNATVEDPGTVTFSTAGTYTVTFRVTDKDGDAGTDSRTITVKSPSESSAPTAAITAPSGNVTINAGQSVNFQGTGSGGTPPLAYSWHFGGSIADSTLQNPGTVSFPSAGNYTVTLTVTDADSRQGTDSVVVTVLGSASLNTAVVLASNDLGMHCMDREFSIFSILPPFNVVHAQVLMQDSTGKPILMTSATVDVRYDAVLDSSGSINSTSTGKTDFWQYANSLFGTTLLQGQGLAGYYMPQDNPQNRGAQLMEYGTAQVWFTGEGIPITPFDDSDHTNPYPLMRIIAYDKQGSTIGHLDIVVPVATETDCQSCHKTGGIAADDPAITWATDANLEIQAKKNILKLHDEDQGTSLEASTPVLCAQCHYSPALDLAGAGASGDQVGNPTFSKVMHEFHGDLTIGGTPVFPPNGSVDGTCYQCHPGKITQCQRGAMKTAGMDCKDCHGNMPSVGGKYVLQTGGSIDGANDGRARRPWKDLPRCQACHTGDAFSYLTGSGLVADPNWPFRLRQAYRTGDNSASPLLAVNKRFAENTNTLYRFSKGHAGITCEGCHGSTHAEWPNAAASANDNVAAMQLQGHTGKIMECVACHRAGSLLRTTNGPHGMHNVNDSRWFNGGHEGSYESNPDSCRACHGLDLTGTPLARVPVARTFSTEEGTVTIAKGNLVSCNRCHEMPGAGD